MKICVLDGAQAAASALQKLLEENSLQAEVFPSFAKAEPRLDSFHIVIADFMLPDLQGAPLLERLAKKTDPAARFLFVSAVFNESQFQEILPESLKTRSFFLKKPIHQQALKEKLNQIRQSPEPASDKALFSQNEAAGFWNPDLLPSLLKERKAGQSQEADSRFLIPALINLNRDGFSGCLIAEAGGEEIARITFQSGGIVQMISKNASSLFGALLVEHGFSLQEEIKEVLASQKDKKIGAGLLEKGLLSPHVVHLILREQIKIRLSDLISEGGFLSMRTAAAKPVPETEKDGKGLLEFQTRDLLDWTANCIQTKFSEAYWDAFYEQNKQRRIQPLKAVSAGLLKNRAFADQYKRLFSELKKPLSLEELFRRSGVKKRAFSETVFFAALSRSIALSPLAEGGGGEQSASSAETDKGDNEAVRKLAEVFLQRKPRDFFETLHLPWKAPVSEVKKHYKMIVRRFHPDRLPKDADDSLKDMCRRILQEAGAADGILSNEEKRKKYIEEKEADNLAEVMSIYQKGIAFLDQKSFKEALELFHSIKSSSFCPKEIALYILQAEIQTAPLPDPQTSGEMREKISRMPIELHVSPLFWFVSGLFYSRIGQYEKAASFFRKTIAIDKRFIEASRELLKIKKEIKQQMAQHKKPGLLQKLFSVKKSA